MQTYWTPHGTLPPPKAPAFLTRVHGTVADCALRPDAALVVSCRRSSPQRRDASVLSRDSGLFPRVLMSASYVATSKDPRDAHDAPRSPRAVRALVNSILLSGSISVTGPAFTSGMAASSAFLQGDDDSDGDDIVFTLAPPRATDSPRSVVSLPRASRSSPELSLLAVPVTVGPAFDSSSSSASWSPSSSSATSTCTHSPLVTVLSPPTAPFDAPRRSPPRCVMAPLEHPVVRHRRQWEEHQERQQRVDARRALVPRIAQLTRAAMWASVIEAQNFGYTFFTVMARLGQLTRVVRRIIPAMRLRRARRLAAEETQRLLKERPRPTAVRYEVDAVMRMLPRPVLERVAATAVPRSFAPRQALMYQDTQGDANCFYVAEGQVEILVRRHGTSTVVATVGPEVIVGGIAMITGASRIATVRARTAVVAWECSRHHLVALLDGQRDVALAAEAAITEVTRLHEANLMVVWSSKFPAADLREFDSFTNVPQSPLDGIRDTMVVRMLHPGRPLLTTGQRPSEAFVLLRGAVRVMWPKSQPRPQSAFGDDASFIEALSAVVDFPGTHQGGRNAIIRAVSPYGPVAPLDTLGTPDFRDQSPVPLTPQAADLDAQGDPVDRSHTPGFLGLPVALTEVMGDAPKRTQALLEPEVIDGVPKARCRAPKRSAPAHQSAVVNSVAMLGLLPVMFNEEALVDVVAENNCEVLVLNRDLVSRLALHDPRMVRHVRNNMMRMHTPWISPLLPAHVLYAATAQLPPRLRARLAQPPPKWRGSIAGFPEILDRETELRWGPGQQDVFVIAQGSLSTGCRAGSLWPPLYITYFGDRECTAFVSGRVVAWRLPRSGVVKLLQAFGLQAVQDLERALTTQYEVKFGAAPPSEHPTDASAPRMTGHSKRVLAANSKALVDAILRRDGDVTAGAPFPRHMPAATPAPASPPGSPPTATLEHPLSEARSEGTATPRSSAAATPEPEAAVAESRSFAPLPASTTTLVISPPRHRPAPWATSHSFFESPPRAPAVPLPPQPRRDEPQWATYSPRRQPQPPSPDRGRDEPFATTPQASPVRPASAAGRRASSPSPRMPQQPRPASARPSGRPAPSHPSPHVARPLSAAPHRAHSVPRPTSARRPPSQPLTPSRAVSRPMSARGAQGESFSRPASARGLRKAVPGAGPLRIAAPAQLELPFAADVFTAADRLRATRALRRM